ncbi:hypothetical protein EU527_03795 [Candidatus Thorarchaeota archaeon]|nr:MAG: hypothetical protein EU527_03795 [Candidatus Thorarchaeota archaeon]
MTVVRGVVREIGRSRTTRITASQWYGSTDIVIQNEETGKIYTIRISANVLDRCKFLPRVGMSVIAHGYVEEDEYGLSDYIVTRVTDIKREGAGVKRVHKFDD